jgi:hypothetical protein
MDELVAVVNENNFSHPGAKFWAGPGAPTTAFVGALQTQGQYWAGWGVYVVWGVTGGRFLYGDSSVFEPRQASPMWLSVRCVQD